MQPRWVSRLLSGLFPTQKGVSWTLSCRCGRFGEKPSPHPWTESSICWRSSQSHRWAEYPGWQLCSKQCNRWGCGYPFCRFTHWLLLLSSMGGSLFPWRFRYSNQVAGATTSKSYVSLNSSAPDDVEKGSSDTEAWLQGTLPVGGGRC